MITYEDKVALNENTDIADINKVTAGDMNQIKQVVNSLANLFFPIKKIVIFNDNDDHSNYLGFTWERIASGKMLIGIDSTDTDFNTIGKVGGEKTHTLTIDEMPQHNHKISRFINQKGFSTPFNDPNTGWGLKNDDVNGVNDIMTTYSGGGQAHNNMPPYYVVAYWQRIS